MHLLLWLVVKIILCLDKGVKNMNISGMITGLKKRVRDVEDRKAVKVANELKSLKAERVRAEGQKKLYNIRSNEVSRTKKARAELRQLKRESSVIGRVGLAVQKNIKENKKKGKDAPSFMASGKDHPMFR